MIFYIIIYSSGISRTSIMNILSGYRNSDFPARTLMRENGYKETIKIPNNLMRTPKKNGPEQDGYLSKWSSLPVQE